MTQASQTTVSIPPPSWRETRTSPHVGESVPVPRVELRVEREGGEPANRVVVLDGDLFRLGSHEGNDVVLGDPAVSRFHCRLIRGVRGWSIADSGSLNGTRVQGVAVRDADLPMPECRVEIGRSIVRVRELRPESSAQLPSSPSFGKLVGQSVAMRQLFAVLDKVAKSEASVLIEGESGTGKELVAREIVRRGDRPDAPFLVVDCGAIAPNLIEAELFGHVRGAFTGADRGRVGAFEAADGGTILLDEIGELPLEMQPKLLRALEAREIRRIGENTTKKVDVRILAATNRRLEREVNQGRFREDLYFRLSVVTVRVPPLRERPGDLPLLVETFLGGMNAANSSALFTAEVLSELARYDWPGNVRELRNFVERSVVLQTLSPADPRASSSAPPSSGPRPSDGPPDVELEESFSIAKERAVTSFEQRYLGRLMSWSAGNVSKAARKADMDRMHLHRLLLRHGLR